MMSGCADIAGEVPATYVVKPQDTLYSIAWRHGLDYHDLARWNHIGADYRIVVGQSLLLHGAPVIRTAAAAAPAARARAEPPTGPVSALTWVWPTNAQSAPRPVPSGGILLPGRLGQEIRAACAGRVVYVGDGIRGYGNLIIIKHGENLLSAYAHNQDVQVHEAQDVQAGQPIAHMGEGVPGSAVLYFEIRRDGKPVPPLPFLPIVN